MNIDYSRLETDLVALCAGETDVIALMATVVCEVHHGDSRFDWTGFYRNMGDGSLKIGPYQGGHGCLFIPFSRGVCGAAARTGKPQLVDDVNAIEDHIACSSSTRSELVLPVRGRDGLLGVFDIDSDQPGAFTVDDVGHLDRILTRIFAPI